MAGQKLAELLKGRSLLARLLTAVLVLAALVALDELAELLYELDLEVFQSFKLHLKVLQRHFRKGCEQLQQFSAIYFWLRPLVVEPTGLQSRLKAGLPRRTLSDEEVRKFDRDGVLLLRGLVRDKALLKELVPSLAVHQNFHQAHFTRPWEYNGVARALLRQEQLLPIFSHLLLRGRGGHIAMHEAPIWGYRGDTSSALELVHLRGEWHMDQSRSNSGEELVSLWLALSKAPHSIEFIRGTHRIHEELTRRCNESWGRGARFYYEPCVHNITLRLTEELGYESIYWEDLEPGDAFLFQGNLMHRPVKWTKGRTALSMRFAEFSGSMPACGELPLVFVEGRPHPMNCVHDRIIPRPTTVWPQLLDRLPLVDSSAWGAWMLRQAFAAASWAVFPVRTDLV